MRIVWWRLYKFSDEINFKKNKLISWENIVNVFKCVVLDLFSIYSIITLTATITCILFDRVNSITSIVLFLTSFTIALAPYIFLAYLMLAVICGPVGSGVGLRLLWYRVVVVDSMGGVIAISRQCDLI